jgi:hypothetical protein
MAMKNDKPLTVAECVKAEATIRSIGGGLGYTLVVHNQGHHWRFASPFGAVDWWPSTGRWSARQVGQAGRVRTLGDLRRVLTAAATIKTAEPAWSPASRVSAKDVEPDYTRKCSVCRNPPALPITGMCEACTYGEAPG